MDRDLSQHLFKASRDPLVILDPRLRVLSANPACERLWGLPEESMLGRGLLELAGRAADGIPARDALGTAEPSLPRGWAISHRLEDGRILCSARQDALGADSWENPAQVAQSAASFVDAVSLLSPDGRVLYVNESTCRLFGCRAEEMVGQPIISFAHGWTPEMWEEHWSSLRKEGSLSLQIQVTHRSGERMALDIRCNHVRLGEREYACGSLRNITDRILMEEKLLSLTGALSAVLDNLPLGVFCKDVRDELRFTIWNRKVQELTGIPAQEAVGSRVQDIFPQEIARTLANDDQAILSSLLPLESTRTESLSRDSRDRILHTRKVPILDRDGKPIFILGITEDIGARLRTEERMWHASQRQKIHFEQTLVGSIEFDLEGTIKQWNAAAERIFGHKASEVVGKHWQLLLPDEGEANQIHRIFNGMLETRKPFRNENLNVTRDGRLIHCQWHTTPLLDSDGKVTAVASLVLDVTEERNAKLEQERLQAIIDATSDFVGIASPDREVLYRNPALKRVASRDTGDRTVMSTHPEWVRKLLSETAFPTAIATGQWIGESAVVGPNGGEIPVSQLILAHRSRKTGEIEFFATIMRDISDIRQREKLIEEQRLKIIHSSRMSALGEMAGGIAHEINNPLAIISGNASLLSRLLNSESPDFDLMRKSSQNILMTCQRIARIIRGLRGLSRDGASDPCVPFPLGNIVTEVLELCQSKLTAAGIQIRTLNRSAEPLPIECRPVQISQVLLNLLNNAYDAISSLPERWIELDLEESDSAARIRVTDSGPGIPEPIRERIFLPFFTTKAPGKGTGIGLSISQAIISEHGGSLTIDSESRNTSFVITLPLSRTRPDSVL